MNFSICNAAVKCDAHVGKVGVNSNYSLKTLKMRKAVEGRLLMAFGFPEPHEKQ